jgi:hypothetical protein
MTLPRGYPSADTPRCPASGLTPMARQGTDTLIMSSDRAIKRRTGVSLAPEPEA